MGCMTSDDKVYQYVQQLYGKALWLGCKHPLRNSYTLGFGKPIAALNEKNRYIQIPPIFIRSKKLNVVCRRENKQVFRFRKNTDSSIFDTLFKESLYGLNVERIEINEENRSLWLDLGDFWLVNLVDESEDCSWTFTMIDNCPYTYSELVAGKDGLKLTEGLKRKDK